MDLLAAFDVGGTKTRLILEALDGRRVLDVTEPSEDWEAEPANEAAAWLAARIARHLPRGANTVLVAVGAQGVDRPETAHELETALNALGHRTVAVNDAALLVPAAGFDQGIGVIAGTGSIAVGTDRAGNFISAGGWGWVIGDDGGAAALVREATRAALRARDGGAADDGLLGALIEDFGVADSERLTRRVNDVPTMDNWAPHASAVFAAADAGSALARQVIADAGNSLAALVGQLRSRGAIGTDVVIAGSVILNQSRLRDAFSQALSAAPGLAIHPLSVPPVEGAVRIARKALAI